MFLPTRMVSEVVFVGRFKRVTSAVPHKCNVTVAECRKTASFSGSDPHNSDLKSSCCRVFARLPLAKLLQNCGLRVVLWGSRPECRSKNPTGERFEKANVGKASFTESENSHIFKLTRCQCRTPPVHRSLSEAGLQWEGGMAACLAACPFAFYVGLAPAGLSRTARGPLSTPKRRALYLSTRTALLERGCYLGGRRSLLFVFACVELGVANRRWVCLVTKQKNPSPNGEGFCRAFSGLRT